jgi:AcrR family transcriptional regulator
MSSPVKSRRVTGHRARKGEGRFLKEEILDATEDLLFRHGTIDAVSIRAIADGVGVTPPAIYLHFADKEQLFYAVCRRGFDRFAGQLEPVLASGGRPIERIRRLGEEYVRFGMENWQQYPILFGVHKDFTIPDDELADDPGLRVLGGLIALVEEAQAAGEIRRDLAASAVAAVLWAGAHGLVELLLSRKDKPEIVRIPPAEELVPAMFGTLLDGLRPRAA